MSFQSLNSVSTAAVCSAIFIRTNAISNLLWKFQRYILVIEYEARPILPPPLVILCHVYLLCKYIRRKCQGKQKFLDNGLSKSMFSVVYVHLLLWMNDLSVY